MFVPLPNCVRLCEYCPRKKNTLRRISGRNVVCVASRLLELVVLALGLVFCALHRCGIVQFLLFRVRVCVLHCRPPHSFSIRPPAAAIQHDVGRLARVGTHINAQLARRFERRRRRGRTLCTHMTTQWFATFTPQNTAHNLNRQSTFLLLHHHSISTATTMDMEQNNCSQQQQQQQLHHALLTFDDVVAGTATTVTDASPSSVSGCANSTSPSEHVADFDLGLLSARITDTDLLVQSLHLQTQEIASLKAQLASLNQSVARVAASAHTEQLKSARLQNERDESASQVARLGAELATQRQSADAAKSLHDQQLAEAEQRCSLADAELIDVCRQFLVQGNTLADSHLSNGAQNRQYMRVAELLKRRGQNVDGLVRTTSTKRKRTASVRSSGCSVATQTTPAPMHCSAATMTTEIMSAPPPPPIARPTRTYGTMTDVTGSPAAVKSVCHRATQAMPTTTTRATSTLMPAKTCSIGTSFPELLSVEEIFRQMIVKVPAPLSPIADLPTAERVEMACQTEAVAVIRGTVGTAETGTSPPPSPEKVVSVPSSQAATQSVGTITNIANIRKRIEYARRSRATPACPSLQQQQQIGQHWQDQLLQQQQHMYDIKKEENASPFGSLHDLHAAAIAAATGVGSPTGLASDSGSATGGGNRINPHLSGLWRVLGQLIFSIVGSGRVLDDGQSLGGAQPMEAINRQIQTVVELAQQQQSDAEVAAEADSEYRLQRLYDETGVDVLPPPAKEGYMEASPVEEDSAMDIGMPSNIIIMIVCI